MKNFTSWDRKSVHPPHFGKGKHEQLGLMTQVRVTSKLFMDPTNVIPSDPQVWLLALKLCKSGIFRYFVIYC